MARFFVVSSGLRCTLVSDASNPLARSAVVVFRPPLQVRSPLPLGGQMYGDALGVLEESVVLDAFQVQVLKQSLFDERHWILDYSAAHIQPSPRDAQHRRDTEYGLRWENLGGKHIVVPAGATASPAKRCVSLHAVAAIEHAVAERWIPKGSLSVPDAGWSSPAFQSSKAVLLERLLRDSEQACSNPSTAPDDDPDGL
jgi:hypothetical protein